MGAVDLRASGLATRGEFWIGKVFKKNYRNQIVAVNLIGYPQSPKVTELCGTKLVFYNPSVTSDLEGLEPLLEKTSNTKSYNKTYQH